jgi:hypothetical protein
MVEMYLGKNHKLTVARIKIMLGILKNKATGILKRYFRHLTKISE